MEPKQYNDKIYNKDVVLLRNRIRELEEKILDGRLQVATLQDFQSVFKEADEVRTEFESLYDQFSNSVYTSELNAFFAYEREFLSVFITFLLIFNNYHEAIGEQVVNKALIQQEWEDIVTMVRYDKTEKTLKDFEPLLLDKDKEREYLSNFVQNLNESMSVIGERPQEKRQDMVLIEALKKVDDEIAKIDAARNGSEYFKLKEMYVSLEQKLEKDVFPKLKIKISNTDFWNKERHEKKNIGEICQKIVEENTRVTIESMSHILDAAEDPAYYTEQVKEMLDNPVSLSEREYDYKKIRSKEYSEERKKDIFLDMAFLSQLTLASKIKYVRFILQNIINESGKIKGERLVKVRIEGKKYVYPKRYQPRFEKYMSILSLFENQYEMEKQVAFSNVALEESTKIDVEKEVASPFYGVDEILVEREAELKIKREEVESSMRFLEEEANGILNVDKLVSFPLEGKQVQILESDYVQYQTLYNKRKSIDLALAEIKMKYGYGNQENEDTYYANMNFMEEDGVEKERQEEQKKFWGKKFYQTIIGNRNARFSDLLYILKSEKIPLEFQSLYTRIAFAPKEFLKSKKYTDQTKRKAFQNLRSIFSRFSEKENKSLNISAIVKKCSSNVLTRPNRGYFTGRCYSSC